MRSPDAWLEDLSVRADEEELLGIAEHLEPLAAWDGSRALLGVWLAATAGAGGALGGLLADTTVWGSWRSAVLWLVGAIAFVRLVGPLTRALLGEPIAWIAGMAVLWGFLLGLSSSLAASFGHPAVAYGLAAVAGGFLGLLYTAMAPDTVRDPDAWTALSFALGPPSAALGVATERAGDLPWLDASAGAVAALAFTIPLAVLLAARWDASGALRTLGLVYLHNDALLPRAVDALDRAIARSPADPELFNLRGVARSRLDQPDAADADWRRVAELLPGDPTPHLNRGVDALRHGDLDRAIEAFEASLRLDPDSPRTLSNLGVALERRGDLEGAIARYDRAIALAPDYATAWSNRGHARCVAGDAVEALADCERATELAPEAAMGWVNRGHALVALDRIAEAAECYHAALDLEADGPVHEEARRHLDQLGPWAARREG